MSGVKTKCKVIRIETSKGLRFFSHFGKNDRVQTAWTIAAARGFIEPQDLHDVLVKLKSAKKVCHVFEIECHSEPYDFDAYFSKFESILEQTKDLPLDALSTLSCDLEEF